METLWSPWRMKYITDYENPGKCVFCTAPTLTDGPENLIIHRGQRAYVILNRFPYTTGHLMIVPFEHHPSLENFDLAARTSAGSRAPGSQDTCTSTSCLAGTATQTSCPPSEKLVSYPKNLKTLTSVWLPPGNKSSIRE